MWTTLGIVLALNVGFVAGLMLRAVRERERVAALDRLTIVLGELVGIVGTFNPARSVSEEAATVLAARGLH